LILKQSLYTSSESVATDVTNAYFEKALFIRVVDIIEDQYLDKVILLAHMDGTHGGTSIIDSSPAQRTLTRFGAGKIDESNKKFGSASYFSSTLNDRIEAVNDRHKGH